MLNNISFSTFTTAASHLWDTAKSYLAVDSLNDEEINKTNIDNSEEVTSLLSLLQKGANWFCHCPKKLILLSSLALTYYVNQNYQGQRNGLNSSNAMVPMEISSYFPFPSVSDWNYQITPSSQNFAYMTVIYSAGSLLNYPYQHIPGNFFISPLSLMVLSNFLPTISGQTIETEFLKVFGGNLSEYANAIATTTTGDIVIVGSTYSFGAGDQDVLVAKLLANGSLAWARTFGGSNIDSGLAVAITPSAEIFVTGFTYSFGAGNYDVFLAKFFMNGTLAWVKTIGGSSSDYGYAIATTSNSEILIGGDTLSFGAGNYDILLVKFDANGNFIWARALGESGTDYDYSITITSNEEIFVTGKTRTLTGDYNVLAVKLSANGSLAWARTLWNSSNYGIALTPTTSGDIVVASYSAILGSGNTDMMIAKLYANGSVAWARTLEGGGIDIGSYAITTTTDDDILVVSTVNNSVAGNYAALLAKIYANGSFVWARTLNLNSYDLGSTIALTITGEIVVAGSTSNFGAGSDDVLVAKFDANGTISNCNLTRVVQPAVLSWANINNTAITPTLTALSTTGGMQTRISIQDWASVVVQSIIPQEFFVCPAGNLTMNTQSSTSTSTSFTSSFSTSNTPSGTSQTATDVSSNMFSSATSLSISSMSTSGTSFSFSLTSNNPSSTSSDRSSSSVTSLEISSMSTSSIRSSISSISTDSTNNPSSSSTNPSASQSNSSYLFIVSASSTSIILEIDTGTVLTTDILSIAGNVPANQVIYMVQENNPDIVITVNGVEATQFTQADVEGQLVEIALNGVTCGDYSTDLQLEANVAGSNAPAQQVSLSLVLQVTTCTNAGRLSVFSFRDAQIGFWSHKQEMRQEERPVQSPKQIPTFRY